MNLVQPTTSDAPTSAAPPKRPKAAKRPRTTNVSLPRLHAPGEEQHTHVGPDGRLCVGVWLDGVNGGGRRAVVNHADFERVKMLFGDRWRLKEVDGRRGYVVGMGKASGVSLARALCRCGAGEVARVVDGDPLHLWTGNMEKVPGRAFLAGVGFGVEG